MKQTQEVVRTRTPAKGQLTTRARRRRSFLEKFHTVPGVPCDPKDSKSGSSAQYVAKMMARRDKAKAARKARRINRR